MTTHYLEEAEFCNNIILINSGRLIAEGNPKDLKTNYLKNEIIDLECSDPVRAMEILEDENFVEDTSIFGNNVHLKVNDRFKNFNQINNILEPLYGIKVQRINRISPTLEDVFINLMDREKDV